jgi:hypothetical protein
MKFKYFIDLQFLLSKPTSPFQFSKIFKIKTGFHPLFSKPKLILSKEIVVIWFQIARFKSCEALPDTQF